MTVEKYTFTQLATRYCNRQAFTPQELLARLHVQKREFAPTGWVLMKCAMWDSSHMGELTIWGYGPKNTLKDIPTTPMSPRGLASDMSVAVAYLLSEDLPENLPDELRAWVPPPPPPEKKSKKK